MSVILGSRGKVPACFKALDLLVFSLFSELEPWAQMALGLALLSTLALSARLLAL